MWHWKLSPETLELVRVIILLTLVEAYVLKLYFRPIILFFLFLHYEPVLGIILLLVVNHWEIIFGIHLQLPEVSQPRNTYFFPLALVRGS